MGAMGWELATILQTPAIVQTTFTKYSMKLLMIFQRRLIASFESYRMLRNQSNAAAANEKTKRNWRGKKKKSKQKQTAHVFTAAGTSDASAGYYHQVLKKYIYTPFTETH